MEIKLSKSPQDSAYVQPALKSVVIGCLRNLAASGFSGTIEGIEYISNGMSENPEIDDDPIDLE